MAEHIQSPSAKRPTEPQRCLLRALVDAGATAPFAACTLGDLGRELAGNTMNRLKSCRWVAQAQANRWWITEDGQRALARYDAGERAGNRRDNAAAYARQDAA